VIILTKRRIGLSDLYVMPLMLGGNVFGWTADRENSFAVLDAFVDAGYNGIDTAELYSAWVPGHAGGESEAIIGAWLKSRGRRDRIVLATKVGGKLPGDNSDLSASGIAKAADDSLTRLQTDYIDLYQSHTDDTRTPLEDTLEAYDRLIRAGKVRAIGASHHSADRLLEALEVSERNGLPRYECVQPCFNLRQRSEYEGPLQQTCVQHNLGVITYSSLAKGFVTGRYRTAEDCASSAWGKWLATCLDERGARILGALEEIAGQQGATMAEVALAWGIVQPGVTAPIVATNTVAELGELLGATRLSLDEHQLATLSAASATADDTGGRQ